MYWVYKCVFAVGVFVSGLILNFIMVNMNNQLSYIPLLIGTGVSVLVIVLNTNWQNEELQQNFREN